MPGDICCEKAVAGEVAVGGGAGVGSGMIDEDDVGVGVAVGAGVGVGVTVAAGADVGDEPPSPPQLDSTASNGKQQPRNARSLTFSR